MIGSPSAWESATKTGQQALAAAQIAPMTPEQRQAVAAHDSTLRTSLQMSRIASFLFRKASEKLVLATVLTVLLLGLGASRVAGHLSRNLSRPLQELIGWTERIGRGEPLPERATRRGAPEFEVLRTRMREMSAELAVGRSKALEAERAATLRESARQVAHELKNPLTPIRFAVERLRRDAPADLAETVEVLAVESRRLEEMARSFAQFGRLPEGPRADVDLGEMVRYTARATVPPHVGVDLEIADDVPMVQGHHDALARALANVMLNAVDACRSVDGPPGANARVAVRVKRASIGDRDSVEIAVTDTGCGIPREQLARIWEPYVTTKPGGTGLGLAIARQTVLAHDGEVSADSAIGRGTEIRFVLPVSGSRNGGASHG
jgi:signal transduction histidine kinase